VMYRGDPKGSLEAGTIKKVASPLLVIKSGEKGSLLVGGSLPIQTPNGITFVSVGRQVHVTTTAVDGGGIKVEANFEHNELVGNGPQVTRTETTTVATIQSGGSLRLELGKDPKDLHWVEITVRKAKR
jgi:Flp pilus assembly secretin CpaC